MPPCSAGPTTGVDGGQRSTLDERTQVVERCSMPVSTAPQAAPKAA
jgi:hypothetical protein